MNDRSRQELNPQYGEDEDTEGTSLASKIPVLRWYLRTTRGLGQSRTFFMPPAFVALCALAIHQGFPALEELTGWILLGVHRLLASLGQLLGRGDESSLGDLLSLSVRQAISPTLSILWALAVTLKLSVCAWPKEPGEEELGYVVAGSGLWARCWAVVDKRIYQLKVGGKHLLAYLRDLNVEKVYLPLALPGLLALASASLYQALCNLLYELPARFEGLQAHTAWIPLTAGTMVAVVIPVLGIPMLVNSLVGIHAKSVQHRERKLSWRRRRRHGVLGLIFVLVPIVWMTLTLLAGRL